MVFFTCNACGQSVKKAQVEKHYMTQCRNCEVLSCMDCGKDFVGDAYKEHTKCVSENEKYGGKNYKAPTSGNKGEAKQEQWLQRVRESKETAKLNPGAAQLLEKIAEYPNVPRKKAKFENFVYNSLRIHNKSLVEQVWNIFSQAGVIHYRDLTKEAAKSNNNNESKQTTENGQTDSTTGQPKPTETNQSSDSSHKETVEETGPTEVPKKKKKKKKDKGNADVADKSSKKRKHQDDPEAPVSDSEEMSRTSQDNENKKHKKCKKKHKQNKTEQISQEDTLVQVNGKSKKHKKRHHDDIDETERILGKRKRGNDDDDDDEGSGASEEMDDVENGQEQIQTKKFKWNQVIVSVLQNCADHQLPIKKLRKKVLNEYHACGGDVRIKSKEELRATFDKKVNKNPSFKVHREIVKLVN